MNRSLALLVSINLLLVALPALAQQRVSADVVALNGDTLKVKSAAGEMMELKLADNLRIIALSPGNLSSITPNAYVAVTSIPQADGTLSAVEIRIFPEAMRGTGEGHRPMDNRPGNTMTNATVSNVAAPPRPASGSTMTNATVADMGSAGQLPKMTVTYKGGEKQVLIPAKTPIYVMEVADRSSLVPGAHTALSITRLGDGTLRGDRVTVGKNGSTVPAP